MPKTKISEFSATAGNNTDIDGINISEGCPPSGINDAIRELMAQLKDFQAGTAGDSFNGPVGTTTPAAGAFTNLSASGTFALTGDQVQISEGGTGQTTANAAFNALAPSQTSQAGKYLKTDGTNTSWDAIDINTADITGTLPIANGGSGQTTANAALNAFLPSQTSQSGKYLKTDGTNASWDQLDISTADITGTLPIANGGTGLTALGTGVQTALGQNVTGSGGIVLASSPSLTTPNLGTPSAVTLTNATGLPLSTGVTGTLATTNGGTGLTSFTANGVVYASSSSALTTGSALTFASSGTETTLNINSIPGTATYKAGITVNWDDNAFILYGGSGYKILETSGYSTPNVLKFFTNNAEQMRLTSTGLGIGTSSPAVALHVRRTSGNAELRVDYNGTNVGQIVAASNGNLYFGTQAGSGTVYIGNTANASALALDPSGNLGLGVTPSAWQVAAGRKAIEVGAAGNGLYGYSASNFNMSSGAYFDGSWKYSASGTPVSYYNQSAGLHQWYTAGSGTAGNAISFTQAMTLDASGNLLVGYTTAYDKLQVNGSISSQGGGYFGFYRNGPSNNIATLDGVTISQFGISSGVSTGRSDASTWIAGFDSLRLVTAGTERARITSGGDLLIGVTTAAAAGGLTIYPTGSSGGPLLVWNRASTTSTTTAADFRDAGISVGNINFTNTATAYVTSSDYRLKNTIAPMTGALAKVAALKPVTYKWNVDGSDGEGFIAHELAEVCPQAVTGEKDAVDAEGKPIYQGIDTSFLVATLTAAIQEQQAIINDLRARVAQLEAK